MEVHVSRYVPGQSTPQPPARRWRIRAETPLHIRKAVPKLRCKGFAEPPAMGALEASARQAAISSPPTAIEIPHPPPATARPKQPPLSFPCGSDVHPPNFKSVDLTRRVAPKYEYEKWQRQRSDNHHEELGVDPTVATSMPQLGYRPDPPRHQEGRFLRTNKNSEVSPPRGVVDRHLFDLAREVHEDPPSAVTEMFSSASESRDSSVKARVIFGAAHRDITVAELAGAIAAETARCNRRETSYGRPPFRTVALKSTTFNLPLDPADADFQRDLAADEIYCKMKHNVEEELSRRAEISLRRSVMRQKFHEQIRNKFEMSVALQHQHAVSKAQRVIANEWAEQLRRRAIVDGYEVTPKRDEAHNMVASIGSAELTRGIVGALRTKFMGFGSTHREAFKVAEANFSSSQSRPTCRTMVSNGSRQLLLQSGKCKSALPSPRRAVLAYASDTEGDAKRDAREVHGLPED